MRVQRAPAGARRCSLSLPKGCDWRDLPAVSSHADTQTCCASTHRSILTRFWTPLSSALWPALARRDPQRRGVSGGRVVLTCTARGLRFVFPYLDVIRASRVRVERGAPETRVGHTRFHTPRAPPRFELDTHTSTPSAPRPASPTRPAARTPPTRRRRARRRRPAACGARARRPRRTTTSRTRRRRRTAPT